MYKPKVFVFLATYNGQDFLAVQLDSIVNQTFNHWELWVSDDGSSDNTLSILKQYQQTLGKDKLHIVSGPRKGYVVNFLSMVYNNAVDVDYYAFADQDDYWQPDKLQHAIDWLATIPSDKPAFYCSRTQLVDQDGNAIGYSPLFKRKPSFLNALVQNIAGGNTMVFNHAALKLMQSVKPDIDIVAHDWWVYLLVTGAGGEAYYDPVPRMHYRQHGGNLIGSNSNWKARQVRIQMMLQGRFKLWNDTNTKALNSVAYLLTEENRQLLSKFDSVRNSAFWYRIINTKFLGIHRQTFLGNLGLAVAAVFKKM